VPGINTNKHVLHGIVAVVPVAFSWWEGGFDPSQYVGHEFLP